MNSTKRFIIPVSVVTRRARPNLVTYDFKATRDNSGRLSVNNFKNVNQEEGFYCSFLAMTILQMIVDELVYANYYKKM